MTADLAILRFEEPAEMAEELLLQEQGQLLAGPERFQEGVTQRLKD